MLPEEGGGIPVKSITVQFSFANLRAAWASICFAEKVGDQWFAKASRMSLEEVTVSPSGIRIPMIQ